MTKLICKELSFNVIKKFELAINAEGYYYFSDNGTVKSTVSARSINDKYVIDVLLLKKFIIRNNLKQVVFSVFGKDVILALNEKLKTRQQIIKQATTI